MDQRPGFSPEELRARYDVVGVREDAWHEYAGERTRLLVREWLSRCRSESRLLLNAGAGVHELKPAGWEEICVDLFSRPMQSHRRAVQASVEQLPFASGEFGAVVCVGEVLGYCDPALAIAELARVTSRRGILICDFGNSRAARYWFTSTHGRTADMVSVHYNGCMERIWVYDPKYISSLLVHSGLEIFSVTGTHGWSALLRRAGVLPGLALGVERRLGRMPFPRNQAELVTIVASRP